MIYVLKLKHEKWYVGYTERVNGERFDEHARGNGAKWTKLHKPIACVGYEEGTMKDENELTLQMMEKYQWMNVRGGCWCKLDMNKPPKRLLRRILAKAASAQLACERFVCKNIRVIIDRIADTKVEFFLNVAGTKHSDVVIKQRPVSATNKHPNLCSSPAAPRIDAEECVGPYFKEKRDLKDKLKQANKMLRMYKQKTATELAHTIMPTTSERDVTPHMVTKTVDPYINEKRDIRGQIRDIRTLIDRYEYQEWVEFPLIMEQLSRNSTNTDVPDNMIRFGDNGAELDSQDDNEPYPIFLPEELFGRPDKYEELEDLIRNGFDRNVYVRNKRTMLTFSGKLDRVNLQNWVIATSKSKSLTLKEVSFSSNEIKTHVLIIWDKAFRAGNRKVFDYESQHPILVRMQNPKELSRVRAFMKAEDDSDC